MLEYQIKTKRGLLSVGLLQFSEFVLGRADFAREIQTPGLNIFKIGIYDRNGLLLGYIILKGGEH